MDFDAVVRHLRGWCGNAVTVVLEPDDSVMRGRLHELDSTGTDGALFAVADEGRATTGVAIAVFRDAFGSACVRDGALRVHQGRMRIIVRRAAETEAPSRAR